PLTLEFCVFVVIQNTEKGNGAVPRVDVPISQGPGRPGMCPIDDLDFRIGEVMVIENMVVAARRPVESRKLLTGMEHSDVTHIDEHLTGSKAPARSLGVLRVTGIAIACLELPD